MDILLLLLLVLLINVLVFIVFLFRFNFEFLGNNRSIFNFLKVASSGTLRRVVMDLVIFGSLSILLISESSAGIDGGSSEEDIGV